MEINEDNAKYIPSTTVDEISASGCQCDIDTNRVLVASRSSHAVVEDSLDASKDNTAKNVANSTFEKKIEKTASGCEGDRLQESEHAGSMVQYSI